MNKRNRKKQQRTLQPKRRGEVNLHAGLFGRKTSKSSPEPPNSKSRQAPFGNEVESRNAYVDAKVVKKKRNRLKVAPIRSVRPGITRYNLGRVSSFRAPEPMWPPARPDCFQDQDDLKETTPDPRPDPPTIGGHKLHRVPIPPPEDEQAPISYTYGAPPGPYISYGLGAPYINASPPFSRGGNGASPDENGPRAPSRGWYGAPYPKRPPPPSHSRYQLDPSLARGPPSFLVNQLDPKFALNSPSPARFKADPRLVRRPSSHARRPHISYPVPAFPMGPHQISGVHTGQTIPYFNPNGDKTKFPSTFPILPPPPGFVLMQPLGPLQTPISMPIMPVPLQTPMPMPFPPGKPPISLSVQAMPFLPGKPPIGLSDKAMPFLPGKTWTARANQDGSSDQVSPMKTPLSMNPVKLNDNGTEFIPGKAWARVAQQQQQSVMPKPPCERPPNYDPAMFNSDDYKLGR